MPAKDRFHNAVKTALEKDGWTITDDPLHLKLGKKNLYVDLGAEKLLAAEKAGREIAVEIKSFVGQSLMNDVENALGQFELYKALMETAHPNRTLFLALDDEAFANVFADELGQLLSERFKIKVIVINYEREEIVEWKV